MAKSTKKQDRSRRHPRGVLKAMIGMSTESNFYTGESLNISEGGLFIATYHLLQPGQEVELEFCLPGTVFPIQVRGDVRWIWESDPASDTSPGMGIRFLNLQERDRKQIERFLRQRQPILHRE